MKCQKGTETKRQRSSSSQRCNHVCTGRDGFRDQVEINCFYIPKTLQYLHACGQRSVCSAVMGSEGEVVRVSTSLRISPSANPDQFSGEGSRFNL